MRKLISFIVFAALFSVSGYSQTNALFFNDTVCFGDSTTLVSVSTSTGIIQSVNWDIDSNGTFSDATGQIIKWKFPTDQDYSVGIQVISDIPDTAIYYTTVYANSVPVVDFDIDYPRQCVGSNFFTYINLSSISYGTMTYFWDLDEGITTYTATDTSAVYSIAGIKNVKLVATSDEGCADSITKNAFVITASEADFIINDSLQCLTGNEFVFIDNSITCDPVVEFSWDFNNDSIFTDSIGKSQVSISFPAPGTYWIGLRIITTNGRDSVFKSVTVYPSATVGFTINDSTQCEGINSFDFTNSSFIAPGTISYLWKLGNGDSAISQDITTYMYNSDGDFNVTLTTTSDKGCVDSLIKTVHIFSDPVADFDVNDTVLCLGDTFFFTNYSYVAPPWGMVYSWDMGDGSGTSTAKDTAYLYTLPGMYKVSLLAISDSGCTSTVMSDLYVISSSMANFAINDTAQCLLGNSFSFTEASTNCSPVDTVFWDLNNDGTFGDTSGFTFDTSFSTSGTFTIGMQLITTSDTSIVYKNVNVYPSPQASFTVNDTDQTLSTNNFVFTNTSTITSGTMNYFWDLGDTTFATSKDTGKTYGYLGTFTVRLFLASDKGCLDSVAHNVYVISPIDPGFTSTTVCFGDSTILTDTSKSALPIIAYNWDIDEDGIFGDTTGKVLKLLAPSADTFWIGLEVVTASSRDTIYNDVVVHPVPTPGFEFNQACQGANTLFKDKSKANGSTIVKYYWDFDNDKVIDDSSGASATFQYANAGNYLASLTLLTDLGCTNKATQSLSVYFMPNADFTYSNTCVGDSVEFKNISSIGGLDKIINFHWNYGDGNDAIIKRDHKHVYNLDATYNVILTALSSNGCIDSSSHTLTVYPNPRPSLSFSGDTVFFEGQNVTITVSSAYDSIFWSNGETQTTGITVSQSGIYSVRVVNSDNCDATREATILVKPIPEVDVVDIFTPNGDGVNDYLIIDNLTAFEPLVLTIYNRWGDEVYSSNDYKNDWDGSSKSKILPEGTYYYIIKTNDGKVLKGTVNIIK